jgi:nitroreductase
MFFDLIEKRRSIRRFTAEPIESAKIDRLREAALRAPSSRGSTPWEFVFVTERSLLEELARAKPHGSSFLAGAALGIVVCADPARSDVWVEDAAIATIYLHLAAASLGLGSCWIQVRRRMHTDDTTAEAFIAEALKLPQHLAVEAMLAVGYPDERKAPHEREALRADKVFMNLYGSRPG